MLAEALDLDAGSGVGKGGSVGEVMWREAVMKTAACKLETYEERSGLNLVAVDIAEVLAPRHAAHLGQPAGDGPALLPGHAGGAADGEEG